MHEAGSARPTLTAKTTRAIKTKREAYASLFGLLKSV
jgi:hypothetical protein